MAARFLARWRTHKETSTHKEASTAVQREELILKYKFEGHEKEIWGLVFLHDDVHIMSGSEDGTMRKWNCNTALIVGKPWKGVGGGIYALALSPDGKTIAYGREDGSIWTGHTDWVRSLSWSPSGSQIASGSFDGTILIRRADSGKVEVGPIKTEQTCVWSLAYSPSGERIASGGFNKSICIWNTKTGELVIGHIKSLGGYVTSLVWSSDSTKLYSASDKFARVFDSKSGDLLHRFQHNDTLWSIALSPKDNVLVCVGNDSIAQLWDTKSCRPLGKLIHQNHDALYSASFSRDGKYIAYGGKDGKLTLWMVKDIAPQPPAPTAPQQNDGQSIREETRSNSSSLSLSCLDVSGGFIEEGHDDPYNNFFQFSQQSLPSPSSGFHFPSLFSVRRFLNVISRRHQLPDESVPQERSKSGFFSHRARSNSSMELATMNLKPVPEAKVGEGEGENINDRGSAHDSLSARNDKGKQRVDPPANTQSPPLYDRTPTVHLDSKDHRTLWKWLVVPQPRGKKIHIWFPTSQHSTYMSGSSRCRVDVAACRDEDRYGIVPESDAEAAAAMLRTNDDVPNDSTRPGQPAVVVRVSQGLSAQIQPSTSGPEEIVYEGVSCCGFFFGRVRDSNLR
ncbi:WD40 repeat-like protein [Suillus hirtellus]|nr:WD40 repeat-like protein [Suillus hirtellus]